MGKSPYRVLTNPPRPGGVPPVGAGPAFAFQAHCSTFRRHLHGKKLKFTPERAAILDAALKRDGLFSADELVAELAGSGASRATVYRTLQHLRDAGIVRSVLLEEGQGYFEVAAGRTAHDYVIEVDTGTVIEADAGETRELARKLCSKYGLDLVGHQLVVYGARRSTPPSAEGGEGDDGK